MSEIVNENEIRVWAMRRSGHHAIINWIASLFDEPVWFFNHVRKCNNPYRKRGKYHGNLFQQAPEILKYFCQVPWKTSWPDRPGVCLNTHKQCLVYNHEDHDLETYRQPIEGLGKSRHQFSVLIMRSFRNMLASRLYEKPRWNLRRIQQNTHAVPDLYRMYAREFLGITNFLTFTPVKIWFDLWFTSKRYRQLKAKELGRTNSDRTLKHMAAYKRLGSTFDAFDTFKDSAQDMNVLYRYRQMDGNQTYHKIIRRHPYLLKLSDKVHEKALSEIRE